MDETWSLKNMRSLLTLRSSGPQPRAIKHQTGVRYRYYVVFICMIGLTSIDSLNATFNMTISRYDILPKKSRPYATMIYSVYYLGSSLFALAGGRVGELYSAKWLIFSVNLIVCAVHTMTPFILHLDSLWFILGIRFAVGIASGITYPAMTALLARWSPPAERFIMCSITFGGMYLGYTMGLYVTTLIHDASGWETTFYLSVTVFIIWLILHGVYVQDYPAPRKGLTDEEVEYISSSLSHVLYNQTELRKSLIPWKKIFKSPPFYALLFVHIYTRALFHLTRMRTGEDAKQFRWIADMSKTSQGVMLASPYLWSVSAGILVTLAFSTLASHDNISKPAAIRFVAIVSMVTSAFCLVIDYYAASEFELLAKPLIIIMTAIMNNMIETSLIEIAPNYAGTLMGITSGLSNLLFVIRIISTKIVTRRAIYATIVVYSVLALVNFVLLLSVEVQPWNRHLDTRVWIAKQAKDPKTGKGKATPEPDPLDEERRRQRRESRRLSIERQRKLKQESWWTWLGFSD